MFEWSVRLFSYGEWDVLYSVLGVVNASVPVWSGVSTSVTTDYRPVRTSERTEPIDHVADHPPSPCWGPHVGSFRSCPVSKLARSPFELRYINCIVC